MKIRTIKDLLFQVPPAGVKERYIASGTVLDVPESDAARMVTCGEAEIVESAPGKRSAK